MIKSAGVLIYKIENNNINILLCHCGGPYYVNKENSGWSLSKGEFDKNENALEAAKRELKEETNLTTNKEIKYLASKKISHKKLLIMFYVNDNPNLDNCKSNTFELEFPKNSKQINSYPEMDNYKWFEINKAKEVIFPKQIFFLERLEKIIKEKPYNEN